MATDRRTASLSALALLAACAPLAACPTGKTVGGVHSCGGDTGLDVEIYPTSGDPSAGPIGGPGVGPDATVTVHIYSNNFSINPSGQPVVDAVINYGDTIFWDWDASTHSTTSVTGMSQSWDSGLHSTGFTFSHTFPTTGVYTYYCSNHGSDNGNGTASGMSGTITVIDPVHSTWNTTASSNWDTASAWFGNVPNSIGMHATLGTIITAARTVTLNTGRTVGHLTFNNANRYTVSGTGSLTINVASGSATIEVLNGSHTIATPVTLADNTTINVSPAGSTLSMSNQTTATGLTITKIGSGTAEMRNVRAGGLTISAGAVLVTSSGATTSTSNVGALSIAAGARMNLTNNDMVVDYTGTSTIAAVTSLAAIGYAGGAWTGAGLTSSSAAIAASTSDKTALGIAEATDLFTTFPATFAGQSVDSASVLILYTLAGDATLDGTVNGGDFNLLATNFGSAGQRWYTGDFTYNGTVDSADFNVLASNFGKTLPGSAGGGPGASVPEPGSVAMLLGLTAMLTTRVRRN